MASGPPAEPARPRAGIEHAGVPLAGEERADRRGNGDQDAALRSVGVPYTDEQIAGAKDAVAGHTELEALVTYLQQLGTVMKGKR